MIYDTKNALPSSIVLNAVNVAANTNSATLDIQPYQGVVDVMLSVGQSTAGTSPTLDVQIQASDVDAAANYVAYANYTQATNVSFQSIGVDPRAVNKRYLRAVATIGGTNSPSFPVCIVAKGFKKITA
jgi:hypothetical protein